MSLSWDTTGDFGSVVDALESVTLLRRGSVEELLLTAWRFSNRTGEPASAGGAGVATGPALASDTTWQFEFPAADPPPAIGDRLLDAAGACWTLLTVEGLRAGTRWRAESRNLRIAFALDSHVNIEQAIWEDLGSGPEITGWQIYRPAIHARIQPLAVTVDETTDPISSVATFQITLEESLPLDHNHRLVDADGAVYRLLKYEQAERIDVLPVATVRRES